MMKTSEIVEDKNYTGTVVYHGTTCMGIDSIMKEGLVPFVCNYSIPPGLSWEDENKLRCDNNQKFVFVHPDIEEAKKFAVEYLDSYIPDDDDDECLGYVVAFEILPTDKVGKEIYYADELTIKNKVAPERLTVVWKGTQKDTW